jgi:signal transduction histidine kinase
VIAFGSYFAVQTITDNNVRQALLEQQEARQIDSTSHVADQIATDIRGTAKTLELLASHPRLQRGDYASPETTRLLQDAHTEISGFNVIHNIGILDENNIHVNNSVEEARQAIGLDRSNQLYVIETRKQMEPYVSPAFTNALGDFVITVSVPIIKEESGAYLGMLVTAFPTTEFFDSYGTYQSSKIVAFDRKQVYVATTVPEFLGLEYWGERVQTASRANPQLNAAYTTLFAGEPTSTLFVSAVTGDERFVSGSPVFYQGEQVMSVAITTPTTAIYSQVEQVLFVQKLQTVAMLAAVVAAVSALIIYLSKWNKALDNKVKQRTSELEAANNQLEVRDKLQNDFINIAAHELRTPIQPMLGVVELMEGSLNGGDSVEVKRDEIEMLSRNANRLERLSSQLLEMARIEGGALQLHLEPVDISNEIRHIIQNLQNTLQKDIVVRYADPEKPLIVQGDKTRLFEVLSNLVSNAIKFTDQGAVTISTEQSADGNQALVKIVDTGSGIDAEIMPRLFTKFATKSDSGTGIGLYISKKIIEQHNGKIWAQNNPSGRGATFTFSLPLSQKANDKTLQVVQK